MRKIFFFCAGIVLLCLAGSLYYKLAKTHGNVADEEAQIQIAADQLYRAFATSEDEANKKYNGKVIQTNGSIATVSEAGDYISIGLKTSGDGGVNCNIRNKDLPSEGQFHAGDRIIIKGKCTGFLMDVNLVDCVIVK